MCLHYIHFNTIQNIIDSLHTSQDFTYVSASDFIRKALSSYKDGMELTELDEKGEKINTSIRVDQSLKDFYSNLPDSMRSKLIERSIRTFIKNMQ
jgi:Arc/MetJ-type ribon-helix-helix transcriptional regulator